jgi:hypothetical protein
MMRSRFPEAGSLGARWWQDGLEAHYRPPALPLVLAMGGAAATAGLTGCVELIQSRDDMDVDVDALELQRREGWNVGQPGAQLSFPGASASDIAGGPSWRERIATLPQRMQPTQLALLPYYVPTLLQAAAAPSSAELRAQLRPIATPEMARAFARGQALLTLFGQVGFPTDSAVVIDVPGPEAVAVAAGMAARFEPVMTFDNWPHPLGVVPSHLTLGAVLYYAPIFEQARAARPQPAPPVFVLDANRLAPYGDADRQFDNRYLAKLPNAEGLARLGIKHLLYVRPDAGHAQELDDLNADFVALDQARIEIRMLALTDLTESTAPPPAGPTEVAADNPDGGVVAELGEADQPPPPPEEIYFWPTGDGAGARFYFGGSWYWHCHFWDFYGWYPSPRGYRGTNGQRVHVAQPPPVHVAQPPPLSGARAYRPAVRATLFSGPALPTRGLGHVSVRASRWDGHLTGVRAGRSGSFGRVSATGHGGHGG